MLIVKFSNLVRERGPKSAQPYKSFFSIIFMFSFKAIKLHLISHNIHSKIRRQKHILSGGWVHYGYIIFMLNITDPCF